MDERTLYAGVLLVLLAGSGLAIAIPGGGGPPAPPDAPADAYETTDDGTRYTVHPSNLRQGCPAGKDCIPSIDDPRFQSAGAATWLDDDDLVIGVELDGEARAYPLRILNVHEIVNDELAGEPIAVTYCPLCRSGLVFSRTVEGETLTFGVSGKLLDANLVMYDRQTGTYWSQIEGEAVVGALVPTRLEIQPSALTTWGEWRSEHPETQVLSRDTDIYSRDRYGSNPYEGFQESDRVGFGVDEVDDRLPPKEIVYGLAVGDTARAYPEETVREQGIVTDEIDGVPVLVVEDPRDGSVKAFDRRADDGTVTFSATDDGLVDGEGNRWSFDGEALEGPSEGARLERMNTHGFFWFAWSSFHPETEIYTGE